VNVEIASKYALDKDTYVKAKINNVGILGLGYTQPLRDGFKLSLVYPLFDKELIVFREACLILQSLVKMCTKSV
jgi:hypothetical protein